MEEAIISKLLADSGVGALVGSRVFPGSRPQASALPCIVMYRISGAPGYADDGEIGIEQARMQLDCWGQAFTSAKQVSRAVQALCPRFMASMPASTFASSNWIWNGTRARPALMRSSTCFARLSISSSSLTTKGTEHGR